MSYMVRVSIFFFCSVLSRIAGHQPRQCIQPQRNMLRSLSRCAFAVVLRYTSRVARLLHTAVSGDGLYKAVREPKFDLTLARMASERSLRTFVVWPPVVHLQRDDDDTPTDGYGGNSSRFIEAYLGMDER